MMEQYLEIKAAHQGLLLFYRMGDFYELFFEDAELASKALGIVLTKRGKHNGLDIPMCGVPVERAEDYLHRLIEKGFRVRRSRGCAGPRQQERREARRDPAGHAGHADRGHAARCARQQLSAGNRA
jgi:DNA mismatch repair protein MutS